MNFLSGFLPRRNRGMLFIACLILALIIASLIDDARRWHNLAMQEQPRTPTVNISVSGDNNVVLDTVTGDADTHTPPETLQLQRIPITKDNQ